mgnify:CR=1 FL=1
MNTLLFESEQDRQKLLPLTYTRSIGHLLVGILTIEEKWAMALGGNIYHQTSGSVQELYPLPESFDLKIHAGLLPDESLVAAIKHLQAGRSNVPVNSHDVKPRKGALVSLHVKKLL